MGPGLLSGQYQAAESSVDVRAIVEANGGLFIEEHAAAIDATERTVTTAAGRKVAYDVLCLNIGSGVSSPAADIDSDWQFRVKPVSQFLALRNRLLSPAPERSARLLIVGGGPAGCEAAANAHALCACRGLKIEIKIVTASDQLLAGLPARAGQAMARWCQLNGVSVATGRRLSHFHDRSAVFEDGSREQADLVVLATGIRPPDLLERSDLATDAQGAIVVDEHLQSISHPGVFGGGDCICFQPRPLDRVGVYAVRQGPVLYANLREAVSGKRLTPFSPQRQYLLILNLGNGNGLLVRGTFVASGRMMYHLKQWLDRRFIRRFQSG
jgi:NADH dehydrogenase FAD-containing subunit